MVIRPICALSRFTAVAFLFFTVFPVIAAEKWSGSGSIRFLGKSTLHDFTGTVAIAPFTLTVDDPESRDNATLSGTLTASVAKMDTQDEKRDENMRASLEAAKHPLISVALSRVKVADTKPQWEGRLPKPATVPFELTILGKTKAHTGRVTSWSEKQGAVTMVVAFPVSLKDYNIKVPTVLGVIRVKDTIEVEATIELKP
jgi:polyisoprenoid-binding protein YceI